MIRDEGDFAWRSALILWVAATLSILALSSLAPAQSQATLDPSMAVMVYFRDKGYREDRGLKIALEKRARELTVRSLQRRAKVGRADLDEIDLPVCEDYVRQITSLGGRLRHRLRWLNAASFEMTKCQMDSCQSFYFVDRVEPLKRRVANRPDPGSDFNGNISSFNDGRLLNYGPSYRQNLMINAVICHDSGYSGAGVLVAMLDNGFRKNHQAFASILSSGRLVDEWDFVTNQDTVDWSGHGTGTWSLVGGYAPGQLIGPAYGAQYALYHTEDNSQEMPIEEDHWAAALERADSIGADIVSSSLGYRDFDSSQYSYSYSQLNGQTAISTIAAKQAAALGIIVCNAMGNEGPDIGSLVAPADADSIISVGATDSFGVIASYSSRGPTYEGRPKPEVCAQGSATWWARYTGASDYGRASGTSCATPLVAGACALLLEAHPQWTPMQVREALMMTASRASNPDSNTYGWGVIDVWAAMHYNPTGLPLPEKNQDESFSISIKPNPASSRLVIRSNWLLSDRAVLKIYNIAGRLIFQSTEKSSQGVFVWDGRDLQGNWPGSGLYFCLIKDGENSAMARVVLIRGRR